MEAKLFFLIPIMSSILSVEALSIGQNVAPNQGRMMGLDTGNEAADFEAGIWLMALVGALAAAVPVAFLNPSLGFKKKRSVDSLDDSEAVVKSAIVRSNKKY